MRLNVLVLLYWRLPYISSEKPLLQGGGLLHTRKEQTLTSNIYLNCLQIGAKFKFKVICVPQRAHAMKPCRS